MRDLARWKLEAEAIYEDQNVIIWVGPPLGWYLTKEPVVGNGLIVVEVINGEGHFYPRTAQMAAIIRAQREVEERRFPDRGDAKTVAFYRRALEPRIHPRMNGQEQLPGWPTPPGGFKNLDEIG